MIFGKFDFHDFGEYLLFKRFDDLFFLDFGHGGRKAIGARVRKASLFFDGLKLEKFIDLLRGDLDLNL